MRTSIRVEKAMPVRRVPRCIPLDQRGLAVCINHAALFVRNGQVVHRGADDVVHAIPVETTQFVLVGEGSSLTAEAADLLILEGVPFAVGATAGLQVTMPTVRRASPASLSWMRGWLDDALRTRVNLLFKRIEFVEDTWARCMPEIRQYSIYIGSTRALEGLIKKASNVEMLNGLESQWQAMITEATGVPNASCRYVIAGRRCVQAQAAIAVALEGVHSNVPLAGGLLNVVDLFADAVFEAVALPMAKDAVTQCDSQAEFVDALMGRCREVDAIGWVRKCVVSVTA